MSWKHSLHSRLLEVISTGKNRGVQGSMWGERIVFHQNFDRSRSSCQVIGLAREMIFMGLSGRHSFSPCVSLTRACSCLGPLLPSTCHTGYENKPSENKMHLTWDMAKVIVASSLCLSPSSACLLHKVFHDLCMFPSWSLEQPNKDISVQGDSMVVVVFCFHFVICRCYLNANLIRMKNSRVQ